MDFQFDNLDEVLENMNDGQIDRLHMYINDENFQDIMTTTGASLMGLNEVANAIFTENPEISYDVEFILVGKIH